MIAVLRAPEATYLMQIFASAFLAILFLQSGIDKIIDRRGNFEWLKGHFANSAVGCVFIILSRDSTVAFYGAAISAVTVLALFFGQRIAKDYAGAAVLVPYFLLVLVAMYLLAQQ
jgi:diacylglycerol kinase